MSLHNLAQQLAAQGRGGDTILAHINPQEAALLKSLGGSGTINPKTGLPEYWNPFNINNYTGKEGLLRKTVADDLLGINTSQGTGLAGSIANNPILAPIAGAGLAMIPGVGPLLAAGLVGGFTGIQSGSLKNGLMAGLGAYGGASLAGSFGAGAGAGAGTGAGSNSGFFGNLFSSGTTAPIVEGVPSYIAPTENWGSLEGASSGARSAASSAASQSFLDKFTKAPLSTLGGGNPLVGAGVAALPVMAAIGKGQKTPMPTLDSLTPDSYIRPYRLTRQRNAEPYSGTGERRYFNDTWEALTPYKAGTTPTGATGGVVAFNQGGLGSLGGYSDGGRLLRGPGDGVSDNIPATIGDRQPARLADGEFVVPARIVSEIGNGSTEAGARKLYAMMDRVQRARRKTVGKNKVATDTNAERLLPA
jgi:hypothetical protein